MQAPPAVHIEASWSLIVAFSALLVTVYNTMTRRDAKNESEAKTIAEIHQKVNIMWSMLFPASISHALRAGILEKNSPLKWSLEALERHKGVVDKLKCFYEEEGSKFDDMKLLLALSEKFEPEITSMVKQDPLYNYEAVLLSAFYLCRPDADIFKKYKFAEREEADGQCQPG